MMKKKKETEIKHLITELVIILKRRNKGGNCISN